jgi:hypothetical protein
MEYEELNPEAPLELPEIATHEQRKAIAEELSDRYAAWESHIGGLAPRWDQIEREIRNDPETEGEDPWPGFIKRHIPVLSGKARAWLAYVCGPPTQASPYLVGTMFGAGSSRASKIEQDFYMFMKKAHYDRAFRRNVLNVGIYGKSFWRVRPHEKNGKPCFAFEAVSPRNSFIYPNVDDWMDSALNVGHVYESTVGQLKAEQLAGRAYPEFTPVETERQKKEAPGRIDESETIAKEDDHKPVRIVECFDKRDIGEGERWYKVRFLPDLRELVTVLEHPYSVPWYFEMFIHEEQGRVMPETSRFNDIHDLQKATTEQWNLMNAGMQMGAFPTTFSVGWALPQKYAKNKPGTVVPLLQGGDVKQVQSKYDPSVAPLLLEYLDKTGDLMMRMGSQAQGGESAYDKTATGAQIRKLSVDIAVNDDLANMDYCMAKIGEFMQEVYAKEYQRFYEAYGDALAVKPEDAGILSQEILWEMNGKSPANTPQAQAEQAINMVGALAQFNPELMMMLQANGIDPRELIRTIVSNSTLDNKENILLPMDQGGMNAQGNPGVADPMALLAGMGMVPGAGGEAGF